MLKSIRQSGFTIIEMATVIVVISILALIVTTAYQNYDKNAKGSQVGATANAYRYAVKTGVEFETETTPSVGYVDGDFLATCVSSNTNRCCFFRYILLTYQDVLCANNAELKADGYIKTSYTYDIIDKYINKQKSKMPDFNDYGGLMAKCTSKKDGSSPASIYGPQCYTNEVAYTNDFATGYRKGFMSYYLPSKFDTCYSDNVVVFDDADNFDPGTDYNGVPLEDNDESFIGVSKTAKYTRRVTTGNYPFTYCMIAVDPEN